MKYFIHTFGCEQNVADSQRIASIYENKGMKKAKNVDEANVVIVNTCMIRHAPENRIRGLVHKLDIIKKRKQQRNIPYKIIVTGCMTGMAIRDSSGMFMKKIRSQMPEVDEFSPIEEVGFEHAPVRERGKHASIPISNGCNNFCSYCVVPFTRGREVSRPMKDILEECKEALSRGFTSVTLLGQNVNSYGADIAKHSDLKPVMVKHLGRMRIPTLFPHLLHQVANLGFELVDFISSNPWDFSDELIDVIAKNNNITHTIHLPVQSGDDAVLKRMNRWYTRNEYLQLVNKIKSRIQGAKFTTDIIVGFCNETDEEFQHTVDLAKEVQFEKAYVALYSPRPFTHAAKKMNDDVPYKVKKARWEILEDLIFRSKHKD